MAIASSSTDEVITVALADHPEIAACLERVHQAAWRAVDPVVLELCRLRVAMILGCAAERDARSEAARLEGLEEATIAELASWPTSPRFGRRERACLAFTEQFVIDVANVDDDLAAAVSDQLGYEGLRNFVSALLVIEQRQRMRMAWERVLV